MKEKSGVVPPELEISVVEKNYFEQLLAEYHNGRATPTSKNLLSDLYARLGVFNVAQENTARALDFFTAARAQDENNFAALQGQLLLYVTQGETAAAVRLAETVNQENLAPPVKALVTKLIEDLAHPEKSSRAVATPPELRPRA